MKVVMKNVRMIACFEPDGKITPLRFQVDNSEKENITIKVDTIVLRQEEKLAGNRMTIYRCQSIINGVERIYELKYEISTTKWFLAKI